MTLHTPQSTLTSFGRLYSSLYRADLMCHVSVMEFAFDDWHSK